MDVVQHLQAAVVLAQRADRRDRVAVTSRWMPKWPVMRPSPIVETEVVAFDRDGRAVDPPLVGLDVQPAAIEEVAPDPAAVGEVVPEQIGRRRAQERLARRAVLRQHRVVDLRDALMLEDVVERALLVDRVVPDGPARRAS